MSFQDLPNTPAHMSFRRTRPINVSWIHIFTAIHFTPMSLSLVGKPELRKSSSAHEHHGVGAFQPAQLHGKHSCTPVLDPDPLPRHTVCLLVATSLPTCQVCVLYPLKTWVGTHERLLELEAVAWGRVTEDWYVLGEESQGYQHMPGVHSYLTFHCAGKWLKSVL